MPRRPKPADTLAISLSGLCLCHCIAVSLIALGLPILGFLSDSEWIHKGLFAAAAMVSGFVIVQSIHKRDGFLFMTVAGLGLGLMATAAFYEPFHDYETALTSVGAVSLGSAHLWLR